MSCFLLSACLSPVKSESENTYVINTLPHPVIKKPTHKITLLVLTPEASQIYNTTQMAYSTQSYQVNYFSKNVWADTPAQMLQLLLMRSLQNTHYFYAVTSPSTVSFYDYVLNTQLLQLEQRFYAHSSEVIILLRAQLINAANNRVIATKQFKVVRPAFENTPYGGVIAANKAAAEMLAQVTRFCLQKI